MTALAQELQADQCPVRTCVPWAAPLDRSPDWAASDNDQISSRVIARSHYVQNAGLCRSNGARGLFPILKESCVLHAWR